MNDDPKIKTKDLRRERTRKEILAAAAEVFAQKGFHEATIQEIARVAALSAGSLYNYFENKDALFSDLLEDVQESFKEQLAPPPAELPFAEQLRATVRSLFRFGDAHRDHFRFFMLLYWSGGVSLGREMGEEGRRRRELLGRFIHALVTRAQERGDLPPQDAELATLLIVTTMIGFSFRWFHGYGPKRLEECTDQAVGLMLHGILHQPAAR